MAIAWIAWRDLQAVTTNWDNFTNYSKSWHESRGPNQLKPGLILEAARHPSLLKLFLQESARLAGNGQSSQLLSVNEAKADLWRMLQLGELEAAGIGSSGSRVKLTQVSGRTWTSSMMTLAHITSALHMTFQKAIDGTKFEYLQKW